MLTSVGIKRLLLLICCRYTAGLVYKYAVTQDEDDRQRALHRFYAIAFLHNVTGIKGTPLFTSM